MLNKLPDNNMFLPMTNCIIGTMADQMPNFAAIAWVTRANMLPPMLAVCIGKKQQSGEVIADTGTFSLSIPGTKLLKKYDYIGTTSGRTIDKSNVFPHFFSEKTGMPIISDAAMACECVVNKQVELPSHNVFIGEILSTWCQADCITDGAPDIQKMNPFFLSMPDDRYWSLGENIGRAWDYSRTEAPFSSE
ncbi:MAG: flavin reductase family protein [Spartobacteria bacterium]|nr:flavin reductase family protein [Spartobacteria bacterium]